MNPQEQFCPNLEYSARGEVGQGNIVVHSRKEKWCKCTVCGKTFSITTGTAMYAIKKDLAVFDWPGLLLPVIRMSCVGASLASS